MPSTPDRPYLDEATTEQLQKELERRALRDRYKDAQELHQAAVLINSYGRQPHIWSALLKVIPGVFNQTAMTSTDLNDLLAGVEAMAKHVVAAYEHLIDNPPDAPAHTEEAQRKSDALFLGAVSLPHMGVLPPAESGERPIAQPTYVPYKICKICNEDEYGHNEKAMGQQGSGHAYAPIENAGHKSFPVRTGGPT